MIVGDDNRNKFIVFNQDEDCWFWLKICMFNKSYIEVVQDKKHCFIHWGCARQETLFLEVQDKQGGSLTCLLSCLEILLGHKVVCWTTRQVRLFLHLFTFLFGKSYRQQGCFMKCKTSRAMSIYICFISSFQDAPVKHIVNSYLIIFFLLHLCVRMLRDVVIYFLWEVWMYRAGGCLRIVYLL